MSVARRRVWESARAAYVPASVDVALGQVPVDELEVVVDGRGRRLELVAGGGHQPLQAEAHRPLGDVADGDHAAPRPILAGQRLGRRPRTSDAMPSAIADRELHPESLAAGRPLLRPLRPRQRQAGEVLRHDLGVGAAEQPVVGRVRREGPALVIDRDDRVAEAGEDRFEAAVLLLARAASAPRARPPAGAAPRSARRGPRSRPGAPRRSRSAPR